MSISGPVEWLESVPFIYNGKTSVKDASKFYKSFKYKSFTANVGDFVLISQADRTNPDSEEGCDIAKLVALYEKESVFSKTVDQYRAIVQWYSRPSGIPNRAFEDDIILDFEKEVVEDMRPFESDVSIETFYGLCKVVNGEVTETAQDILDSCKSKKTEDPIYACRYRLDLKGKKASILVPVNSSPYGSKKKTPSHLSSLDNPALRGGTGTPRLLRNNKLSESKAATPTRTGTPRSSRNRKVSETEVNVTPSRLLRATKKHDSDELLSQRALPNKKLVSASTPKARTESTIVKRIEGGCNTPEKDTKTPSPAKAENNTWSIKKKPVSAAKLMRDITNSPKAKNSVARHLELSPIIPIVSPIKLVNISKIQPPFVMLKKSSFKLTDADISAVLDSDDENLIDANNSSSDDEIDVNQSKGIENGSLLKHHARRNLATSLNIDKSQNDSQLNASIANYSIVNETPDSAKPIKIKLKKSEKNKLISHLTDLQIQKLHSSSQNESQIAKNSRRMSDLDDDGSSTETSPSKRHNSGAKMSSEISEISETTSTSSDSTASNLPQRRSKRISTSEALNNYAEIVVETPSRRSSRKRIPKPTDTVNTEVSPNKKRNINKDDLCLTPSVRTARRSILKTPLKDNFLYNGTPKKIQLSEIVEEHIISTPSKHVKFGSQRTPKSKMTAEPQTPKTTPSLKMKQFREGIMTPNLQQREMPQTPTTDGLRLARERLHVSAVPKSLPCRENEFNNIYTFLERKLLDQSGGCMYVSGVPGTGKTATVTEVIKCLKQQVLKKKVPNFDFIEINGMRLTEPRQAYVHIYRQLFEGKTVPWEQAQTQLDSKFSASGKRKLSTVLLVDELDVLCNRRQDVVYTLLDWPSKPNARLIVITIANTMDLPERLLRAKVTSRLGLTRLSFAPYSHKQLMEIVTARLLGTNAFNPDAVQLVARKVAALTGDARRALDICRRATEIAESSSDESDSMVSMVHVNKALNEMIVSHKVRAIQSCSLIERLFLQAVAAEVGRTGVEETSFEQVILQLESLCALEGLQTPSPGLTLGVCCRLGSRRLLITEAGCKDLNMRVLLNVGVDDLYYAVQQLNNI